MPSTRGEPQKVARWPSRIYNLCWDSEGHGAYVVTDRGVAYNDIDPAFRLQNALLIASNSDNAAFQAAHRIHTGLGPITGSESSGDSHYHALQVWVNRRFANRLSFQAAYTWSHTISNVPLASILPRDTVVKADSLNGCGGCHTGVHEPYIEQWSQSAHGSGTLDLRATIRGRTVSR